MNGDKKRAMKHTANRNPDSRKLSVLALAVLMSGSVFAAEKGLDFIAANFYPPELVQHAHELIRLTEEQATLLKAEFAQTQERIAGLKQQVETEMEALGKLTQKSRPDEAAVLAQAGKAMKLENEMKQAQLALLVKIKNVLTPEQQQQLDKIKGRLPAIQAKMQRVQQMAGQWQQEGRDLSALGQLREDFEALMKQGKLNDAEGVLDYALMVLEGKQPK